MEVEQVLLAIVSANRAHQVARMQAKLNWYEPPMWVIPGWQLNDYRFQGSRRNMENNAPLPNITAGRNKVLDFAFGHDYEAVCFIDDDLQSLREVTEWKGTHAKAHTIQIEVAIAHLLKVMEGYPSFRLGGIAPTVNWLFVCNGGRVKTRAFVQSNFAIVKRTDLRYDPAMELSEDYDYCLQHTAEYGGIVRDDLVLSGFAKKTNSGGLQSLPNRDAMIVESRRDLHEKWPQVVRWPHPKAGDREVLVKWKDVECGNTTASR